MIYGLVYADNNEFHELYNWELIETKIINSYTFKIFKKLDTQIILLETKIGLMNASLALVTLLENFQINFIINYGAVGALKQNFKLYEVVIPRKVYFLDVITPWYEPGQFPNEKSHFNNNLKNWKNWKTIDLASSMGFQFGIDKVKEIKKNFPTVSIFDMECAALVFIANKYKKEIFIFKGISDFINENNVLIKDINENIKKASLFALNEALEYINFLDNTNNHAN
ncbi:5'-methylthioadenosine/S-adenosylhomocysteine nucleosidase [[Mycoplasma] mobile]|uniref:5'-methylthioadenosine/S-adenosylhomocysteine nucleosidase n=1 Tax=Mycoplasma mobile (strain ATCC 43663 / 163K / NCTC 11711) TaxID=267748 RepID=Q6KI13_MYCM1|nr:5'-methylthioadenosine/S-adenosylhomocysteine nucleosidase [[Mycoplasma] mobile]AAT27763.1 5'-methylthioadenosine/S-adenosylhomocysteine nucleosidase [Mycoplasma mobile 163K]